MQNKHTTQPEIAAFDVNIKASQLQSLLAILGDADHDNFNHETIESYIYCCEEIAGDIAEMAHKLEAQQVKSGGNNNEK